MTSVDEFRLLSILSDQPAVEDQLNFAPYAKTLADIVTDPGTDTPLTIGVFGGWGQGKTSLMRMVEDRLRATLESDFPVRSVWFNAWLYSQQPALWRALISRVLAGVRGFDLANETAQAELNHLEHRLYGVAEPSGGQLTLPAGALPHLDQVALPPFLALHLLKRQAERRNTAEEEVKRLAELIADLESSEALTRRDQIAALDDFRRHFERLSRDHIADHGRLVVFVDDLDRCLPDKAVEVLEAVKLFLDVPGCVFMLGVARDVIEEGIRVRYQAYEAKLDGAQYLEKIIQIPFSLPPIAPEAVKSYVQAITNANLPDARCEAVFAAGLEPNPRRLKRTLNIFLLLWRLAQNREDLRGVIKPVRLAKIVIIQQYHPRLFDLIATGPHYLIDLEKRFREQTERSTSHAPRAGSREPDEDQARLAALEAEAGGDGVSAGPLTEFLGRGLLAELLTCTGPDEAEANFAGPQGLEPSGVREYIYLTRSAVAETPAPAETALPFEPQLVTIPAGPFLMGTPESELGQIEKLGLERKKSERETPQHEVDLPAFALSRYPVTNAEFGRFIEDGGYQKRDFWTETGWKQKESEGWRQPRYWEDDKWNDPSQPVVGVSWYEAVAYCRWLADKTGKPYRLPTEAEWEKAARGSDGRRYPWGNAWEAQRCNNKESGPGRTTPVGDYPEGDSPYGVGDMVGQVWEWCSSKWLKSYPFQVEDEWQENYLAGSDSRVMRGGSWYNDNPAAVCRCGYRYGGSWSYGSNNYGFRCARSLSS